MKIELKPFYKQHLAYQILWDDKTKYFLYGGGAGGGKSYLGCEWLITQCMQYPGVKYFIAREKLKTLKSSTLLTFFKVARKHGLERDKHYRYREQQSYIEFANGSRIDLIEVKFNPSDPMYEDLGSSEYTGGWLEEAGEIAFTAFDVLKSRIGRHMNDKYGIPSKLFITCNPKKNWLYSLFYKPWKENTLEAGYAFLQALVTDNPEIEKSYIQNLRELKDNIMRQRLLYGIWEYEATPGSMYDYDAVTDLWSNVLSPEDLAGNYMTVDVARKGKDKTVIYLWRGMSLYGVEAYVGQLTDITEQRIKELSRSQNIPYSHIVVDEDGVGGGVVDHLRGVHGFINNSSPMEIENPYHQYLAKPNYSNLKTQCADMMATLTNNHRVAITVPNPSNMFVGELEQDLQNVLIDNPDRDTQKMKLVSKDVIKANIGRSPDWGDAFNMRAFFLLKRSTRSLTPAQELQNQYEQFMESTDFDPHSVI